MADVTKMPGVLEQLKLVAGLRWRILKNSLRQRNKRWDLIAMIWVGFISAGVVVGLCFAFFAGGYEFLAKNRPGWIALLYWGIFLWWQVFPIFVAGFGSNFEFTNLLRFPLRLRAFYLLGLGYGLSDFAAVSSICWILAMIAGAATARVSIVPAMLVVSALFVLVNLTDGAVDRFVAGKITGEAQNARVVSGIVCPVHGLAELFESDHAEMGRKAASTAFAGRQICRLAARFVGWQRRRRRGTDGSARRPAGHGGPFGLGEHSERAAVAEVCRSIQRGRDQR